MGRPSYAVALLTPVPSETGVPNGLFGSQRGATVARSAPARSPPARSAALPARSAPARSALPTPARSFTVAPLGGDKHAGVKRLSSVHPSASEIPPRID